MPTRRPSLSFPSPRSHSPEPASLERHLDLRTSGYLDFVDLTDRLGDLVRNTGIRTGMLLVQSLHTTAAIVVNENEPLLIEDLRQTLDRTAPRCDSYRHDDFEVRTANMTPEERPNGHAHCKALFLPTSVTLGIVRGRLLLGRWQRIFLIELDGGRHRTVAAVIVAP